MEPDKRTPVRKMNERHFKFNEHQVWAYRLEARETGETVGVRMKVLFGKFASCPNDYLTGDNGKTFNHVAAFLSGSPEAMIDITISDVETDPALLAVLRGAFSMWQHKILSDATTV